MKILLVGNPISGSGRGSVLMSEASHLLASWGHEATVVATERRGDAREAASRVPAERIVCVGGDGTVNEVVTGLAGRETPIAVVPAGTANVLVRELGLPREVRAVCRAACEGTSMKLDSCVVGERRFLLAAGVGFDASVVHEFAAVRSGTSSYGAYMLPVIRAWARYASVPLSVKVDGSMICEDAVLCILANVRNYIGRWRMLPDADPTDGSMDVLALRGAGRRGLASFALSFLFQRHVFRKDVICTRGRSVEVRALHDESVPVHVDGDPADMFPLSAAVEHESVYIAVPADPRATRRRGSSPQSSPRRGEEVPDPKSRVREGGLP